MDAAFEHGTEGFVVVANDRCWCACQPLCCRMRGHREPQQLPPSVAENLKSEELLKGDRRNHKEINRCDAISVVAKEGFPVCNGRSFIIPRYHVFRHRRLRDLEAELQKLTMDVRRTPEPVFETHSSDKVGRSPLCQPAAGRREGATSIARTQRRPCDANARLSRVGRSLRHKECKESDDKGKRARSAQVKYSRRGARCCRTLS
jgi:hypothetical protein